MKISGTGTHTGTGTYIFGLRVLMKDAAIGIIILDGQVLLVLRRDVPVWVLPGGGIDAGETPEEAVVREVREETGLTASIVRRVGTWLPVNRLSAKAYVFECHVAEIPEKLEPQQESRQVRFWPIESLPPKTFRVHRDWLETALKNFPEPVERHLSQMSYWGCFKLLIQHPILCLQYILSRLGLPINRS